MGLYEGIHWSSGIVGSTATSLTGETAEVREKRMTDYELAQMTREQKAHQNRMDQERQQQDFQLATTARIVFGWCMGVGLVGFFTALCILGGMWMAKH
jgi:hypothetical protein